MTTPRTMTVSELGEYLCQRRPWSEYAKAEDLVGVTIVPDQEPDPRPNFDAMTTCDVLEWCHENYDGLSEQYRDIRRAIIDFANEIADRKGMGR